MTPEFYQFFLSIVGFLFVLMLGIIGYFLKKQVEATEKLELSTNSLDKTVSLLQSNQQNFATQCGFHHRNIDKTLSEHNTRIADNTDKLIEHSEVLAVLTKSSARKPIRKRPNG
jgi:hypothetical protein